GEQCDDGNRVGGDGCSATCTIESRSACLLRSSVLPTWNAPQVILRSGLVTVEGTFAIPDSVSGLDLLDDGARGLLQTASGIALLDATLPSGNATWNPTDSGWRYSDDDGATEGIHRLRVRDVTGGGVPTVEVSLTARGRSYTIEPEDLPLSVTIVL